MKSFPNFSFEKEIPPSYIAIGIDEVGRGCLAGPVVAGAVCLGRDFEWEGIGINDSKKLTAKKREQLSQVIRKNASGWAVGEASVTTINRVGIVKATEQAMRQATKELRAKLSSKPAYILIDAFYIKYLPGVGLRNQKAIIKGDGKSLSIAAASIVAKVYRDSLMQRLHTKYPHYEWKVNKGYGTLTHRDAIKKHGLSKHHRKLFVRNLVNSA